jgi:TRAP-type mannitol/chloroaromatic compound transport system permease small subunit
MEVLRKFCEGVGRISVWTGHGVSFLLPALILSIVYEVISRYAFNAPTIWSFTVSYMMGTVIIALGMCYLHQERGNVRVDLFYNHFPRKVQLGLDIALTAVLFFPLTFMLTRVWVLDTVHAYVVGEVPVTGIFYPPLWPMKALVTIGFALLLLQGIANFIKDVASLAKGGEEPW